MSVPGTYSPGQYPRGGFGSASLTYLEGASVSFGEAIKQAFGNAFVYRSRASLSAYWWFVLFEGLVSIALQLPRFFAPQSGAGLAIGLIILISGWICLAVVGLALTVRRLHDTGRSGWWLFIGLVPFVGPIVVLIFTLHGGTPGPNQYQPQADRSSKTPRS